MMEQENQLNLSSVIQVSSPWKEKTTQTYLSKIIKLQQSSALIIKQDCNQPLRFLYLALLMSKKNCHNMNILLTKIQQIRTVRKKLVFANIPADTARLVGVSLDGIHSHLVQLHKRLQGHSFLHNAILRLSHQLALIDPLLILSLRAVADDYKMSNALDCSAMMGLGQIQVLMNKFFVDKGALVNPRNKYVIFYPLTEIQYEFFRSRGVTIAKESDCFDQLSDSQIIKFQEYIMIQKVFSLL